MAKEWFGISGIGPGGSAVWSSDDEDEALSRFAQSIGVEVERREVRP
jgi:hypothetical protein